VKRNGFSELTEGFDALKADREGTVTNIVGPLMTYLDRFVVGAVAELSARVQGLFFSALSRSSRDGLESPVTCRVAPSNP
jgi:hypothetical protein